MKLLYSIHKYDVFMFTWLINARIYSALTKASRYLSKTGDGHLYVLVAGYLYWLEGRRSMSKGDSARLFDRKAYLFRTKKQPETQPA